MEKEVSVVSSVVSDPNLSVLEHGCYSATDKFSLSMYVGSRTGDWRKYHLEYVSTKLFWGSNQVADMERTDFFFFFLFLALPFAFLSTLQKWAWLGNSYLSSPKAFRRSWFKISHFLEICSTWEDERCLGPGHVFFLPGYGSPVAEWVPVVVTWKWVHHSTALMPACSIKCFGRKRCVWYLDTNLCKHIEAEDARN